MTYAINAIAPYHRMSPRYGFTPTFKVVDTLKERGWEVTSVRQGSVRLPDKEGYQMHMVRMQNPSLLGRMSDMQPELVLLNSHDGSRAFKLCVGFYVYACLNGLMTAQDGMGAFSQYHSGNAMKNVLEGVYEIVERVPMVVNRVQEFKALPTSDDVEEEFAIEAMKLKWKDQVPVLPRLLTSPRRFEDSSRTLWKLYNRVQENLMKGGLPYTTRTGGTVRSRGTRSVAASVKLNWGLWRLTEDTAAKLAA